MKLIYDCDNTIGLAGKDIDDGLTLLYLGQQTNVDLLGVTLTFGNGTVKQATEQTDELGSLFGLGLNSYAGKEIHSSNEIISAAGKFLVDSVRKYPHQITILATGSLANLAEAAQYESDFFKLVARIIVMGGRFKQLTVKNTLVNELNFSVAPEAAHCVLTGGAPLLIASGQYLSGALFKRTELNLQQLNKERYLWLKKVILDWMKVNTAMWQIDGFINWDGMTALALIHPEYFSFKTVTLTMSAQELKSGLIKQTDVSSDNSVQILTAINDLSTLNQQFLATLNKYLV
ncbi:nucleoside hydrolase [Loigolactobacillus iwatensis]|uniref:nucleoside hydrolase n=1 Tax=Loigolactobacillus iwatensis TaxID=1267156 RepID=UPI000F7F5A16|nr:nucleoside hydrolase [Loigolactobacillus iwatensis]